MQIKRIAERSHWISVNNKCCKKLNVHGICYAYVYTCFLFLPWITPDRALTVFTRCYKKPTKYAMTFGVYPDEVHTMKSKIFPWPSVYSSSPLIYISFKCFWKLGAHISRFEELAFPPRQLSYLKVFPKGGWGRSFSLRRNLLSNITLHHPAIKSLCAKEA